jgi:chromosomal replication initiator protein
LELHAHEELTPAWREIRAELRRLVGEPTYEMWLAQLKLKSWNGRVLSIEAPPDTSSWIPKRFSRALQQSVRTVLGPEARAEVSGPQPREAAQRPTAPDPLEAAQTFNPRHNFNQFVIGEGNRMAHAASLAAAEYPGQGFNPLFICAPPGLGKTHLLHAIGNYVLAFGHDAVVRYTTAETFTNQFLAALASRSLTHFKHLYRDVDILLIDDIQFLASKAKTEEEFFHTFNALYENGRQLVLTCDRVPAQLVALEDRLRARFEAGLVTEIRPPDFSARLTILRKRAALDQITLAEAGVLEMIASRITTNVRALEGALIRVVAYHSLTGKPIGTELASTVLDGIAPAAPATATPSLEKIQQSVAAHYGLSVAELLSESRTHRIAWARQVAIHLARQLTDSSLHEVGDSFGGRNHTTVLHSCKRVSDRLGRDKKAEAEVHELAWALKSEQGDRGC